jgi:4-aminobutyrate aminotransferase/(S)-3-amino-2-methylpropionate transaminase
MIPDFVKALATHLESTDFKAFFRYNGALVNTTHQGNFFMTTEPCPPETMGIAPTRSIRLRTEIPGPKSREILARREAAVGRGLSKSTSVVVERAHGALVYDVDGNVLIDFAGGIGVLAAGHTPQSVVDVLTEQVGQLLHMCEVVATSELYVQVCERLNALVPGDSAKKTILSNTGAEAIENAVRAARAFTGRPGVICFENAYHGRSLLTMSLTSKYDTYKRSFGPFAPDVYRLPAVDTYRRPPELTVEQYVDHLIRMFDHALVAQIEPSATAAVIIEPVQGEGGFIPVPKRFLQHVATRCKEHGIVLIIDEVQTGFGRTGTLFAIEQYEIAPDILVSAKSIAAGLPLSAITGRADIIDAVHVGGYGGTYGGNPLACAAALKTIDLILGERLPERAMQIGAIMRERMEEWQAELKSPYIGDIRGMGAMLAMELVTDPHTKTPAKEQTAKLIHEAAQRGLILIKAGMYSNCIRLLMPLMIPEEQLTEALNVMGDALLALT